MVKYCNWEKDTDVYAVICVDADAGSPDVANIKVKLVMGSEGARRVSSLLWGKMVKAHGDYLRSANFYGEEGGESHGYFSDQENGIGIVRMVKVNVEMEENKEEEE